MIKWIHENYDEARAKMEPYRKAIGEKHTVDNMMKSQVDHIRKVTLNGIERNRKMTEGKRGLDHKSKLWRAVQDFIISEYDEDAIRLQSFLKVSGKRFAGFDVKQLDIPGAPVKGVPSKLMFKHMLEKMGYEDNCREAEPIFVRRV